VREAIDENLGTLADLHRVESDDLIGKPIRHFIQHGNASLGVKIPSFDDRITPDKLSAKFGNLVLAIGNFSDELPQLQRSDLWRIRQQVAGVVGKVSFPRGDIVRAIRQSSGRAFLFLVTLQSSLGPSDKGGKFAEGSTGGGLRWW
jgi:hypothetical protein